ncbi:MAG TPA: ABC transporter permease subunit [Baekduia sp.]
MSIPAFTMGLRLRALATGLAALGMLAVIVMVGALFPAVGDSIGRLDLPEGVADLLGGADYGSITGWMRSEIGAVYGPLVIGAIAIVGAVGTTAGEEEDGILGLTLAYPVERWRLVVGKAAAVGVQVGVVALGTLVGLVAGVAIAGGGVAFADLLALAVHLAFFGAATGAVGLALACATGRRAVATGGAAAYAVLGFLVNGFAPLVDGIAWLKYLSLFYYYTEADPIGHGFDLGDLAVLGAVTAVLVAFGAVAIGRRDLRG